MRRRASRHGWGKLADPEAPGAALAAHADSCAAAPRKVTGSDFGCYVALDDPLPLTDEKWLTERIDSPDRTGALLCLEVIRDRGALSITLARKFPYGKEAGSNQVFEPIPRPDKEIESQTCCVLLLRLDLLAPEGLPIVSGELGTEAFDTKPNQDRPPASFRLTSLEAERGMALICKGHSAARQSATPLLLDT